MKENQQGEQPENQFDIILSEYTENGVVDYKSALVDVCDKLLISQLQNKELMEKNLHYEMLSDPKGGALINEWIKNAKLDFPFERSNGKNKRMGEKQCFRFLRYMGVFFKRGGCNIPKEPYMQKDRPYFTVQERPIQHGQFGNYLTATTRITSQGARFVRKLFNNNHEKLKELFGE